MAKKALIHNGIVQQIEESSNTFEVHSNLKWVDCDDSVKVNWTYNGSTFADYDTRTTSEKTAAQWEHVRIERKKLLKASDWTQGADSPLTDSKKAEWKTYRQALRVFQLKVIHSTSLGQLNLHNLTLNGIRN